MVVVRPLIRMQMGMCVAKGGGAMLLKPLSKAKEDHDTIYGIIKGTAVNHGGHVNSLTAPNPNARLI